MNTPLLHRRGLLLGAAATLGAATWPRLARAQTTQTAPLRMLCGAPVGSIPDIIARRYAEQLTGHLAGTVLVENRPGAGGQIAIAALKQTSPASGTLMLTSGAVATVFPDLYAKLAYDPVVDLKPVSMAAESAMGLAVGPAVPTSVTSVRQFTDWLRAHPAQSNFGSPGIGTLPHLLTAMLMREAGVDWQHVAYVGGPPAIIDLMGGRLAGLVLPEGLLRPHIGAGKLRLLATSGATRSAFMPDVPTFVEQGHAGLVVREWFGFFMHGDTPPAMAEAASRAIRQAAATEALRRALAETAMLAVAGSPADMATRIATEQPRWRGVLRDTGIRVE